MAKPTRKPRKTYFRVIVTYDNGETSGNRIFPDRAAAEKRAERLKMPGFIKKIEIVEVATKFRSH